MWWQPLVVWSTDQVDDILYWRICRLLICGVPSSLKLFEEALSLCLKDSAPSQFLLKAPPALFAFSLYLLQAPISIPLSSDMRWYASSPVEGFPGMPRLEQNVCQQHTEQFLRYIGRITNHQHVPQKHVHPGAFCRGVYQRSCADPWHACLSARIPTVSEGLVTSEEINHEKVDSLYDPLMRRLMYTRGDTGRIIDFLETPNSYV
ncbi:hypothetical protein GOP47_0025003 [Adiantum capillus-veneris]|uniref:Uncharacterized protein n=1 Tax=Adiantum capillus-veneris TaxID=13818 RepID=A0A9D4U353_ADICA|nr:hypothetical protein GOP47_0025003 [Adiantum capillus-veneris]